MQTLTLLLPPAPGFCGNSLVNGGSLGTTTANPPKLCPNSQTLTCGGSAGLQLYRNSAVLDANLNVIGGSGAPAATTSVSAAAPAASSATPSTGNGFTTDGACSASSYCSRCSREAPADLLRFITSCRDRPASPQGSQLHVEADDFLALLVFLLERRLQHRRCRVRLWYVGAGLYRFGPFEQPTDDSCSPCPQSAIATTRSRSRRLRRSARWVS
jgi:hypothetical protein